LAGITRGSRAAGPWAAFLGGEEIKPIEGRDDLTTDDQFLQVIAVTQIVVSEDSRPEIIKILNDGV
jgi:hypothetical protein